LESIKADNVLSKILQNSFNQATANKICEHYNNGNNSTIKFL